MDFLAPWTVKLQMTTSEFNLFLIRNHFLNYFSSLSSGHQILFVVSKTLSLSRHHDHLPNHQIARPHLTAILFSWQIATTTHCHLVNENCTSKTTSKIPLLQNHKPASARSSSSPRLHNETLESKIFNVRRKKETSKLKYQWKHFYTYLNVERNLQITQLRKYDDKHDHKILRKKSSKMRMHLETDAWQSTSQNSKTISIKVCR